MKKRMHFTAIIALVVATMMILSAVALASSNKNTGILTNDEVDKIINTSTDASKVSSPFTQVADAVRSSVVGVRNYRVVKPSYYNDFGFGFGFDFGFDFGYPHQQEPEAGQERLAGLGSGAVITEHGHILTNYHVIEDAVRLTVTIEGSDEEYEATVSGYDEDLDIAVLHVNDLPLKPVALGDSDQLQVGEWAIIIGNPLSESFARTMTVGVVSALNREITDTAYDKYGRKTDITNTMIQVDAAINSGNSGGGMFNTLGQLMGIPARKYSGVTSSMTSIDNIGMSIPINVAKPLIQDVLLKYQGNTAPTTAQNNEQATDRPMLGVTVSTISYGDGSIPQGAFVREVSKNSNAERGGIQVGDIIVEVNEEVISQNNQLVNVIKSYKENDVLQVKVYRAKGLSDFAKKDGIDFSEVEEGEYVDLEVELKKTNTSL